MKCDIPVRVVDSLFEYIAQNQDELKTDFITWTGDNAPHNIWENSLEEVKGYEELVTSKLKKALKDHPNIEVYPAVGNHDLFPLDEIEMSKPGTNEAIQNLKAIWGGSKWLNDEELKQFGQNGFYSKPFPNFRNLPRL